MLTTSLQLRLSSNQSSETHALLIPGESAQSWLDEISTWPIEHSDLELIVVPKSMQDLTPRGVLAFGDCIPKAIGCVSPNVVKFNRLANRLFLPINGQLYPDVDDQCLEEALPIDSYCVWHPVGGLTTVSSAETIGVVDLLRAGSHELMTFGSAQPGVALNSRMHSLTLLQPPDLSVKDVLADGKGDIGDDATDLSKLKPISNESKLSGASSALDAIKRPFAHIARKLTSMVPHTASQRTWINGVEDWANNLLNKVAEKAQQRQFLDVYRLQEMLDKNPDEGLKFAMPLSNMVSSGLASTESWLSKNLVNFNLFNLGGGGGIGGPALPSSLHSQLTRRYRELAEREIHLGRYRRAAYIYGNLLFDFSAAAKTLETGKHFREAAILYREKLRLNDDAARCLKEGGFFSEAIELFESLKQFESAGDLYAELGLDDNARDSWQTAADQKRNSGNLLDAARLEEVKLRDDVLALETLASAWPMSQQAVLCLEQTFRILASKDQHQRSRTWIAKIENEACNTRSFNKAVELISKTATNYPDQSTRAFAVDATYRMVSGAIAEGSGHNSQLLKSIAQLHPKDKLLRRDCNRFKPLKKSTGKITRTDVRENLKELTQVATHQLDNDLEWTNATGLREGFLVVGRRERQVIIIQVSAEFMGLAEYVTPSAGDADATNVILATNSSLELAMVHAAFDTRFLSKIVAVANRFATGPKRRQLNQFDLNLESNVIAVCEGLHSQWQTLRKHNGQIFLECLDNTGSLVSSRQLDMFDDCDRDQQFLPPIYCDGKETFVASGPNLIQVGAKGENAIDVGEPIESMAGSVRGVATRIAVSFAQGFRILWIDSDIEMTQLMCYHMSSPKLLFTKTGHLIAVSGNRCEVFHTQRKKIELVGKITISSCRSLFRMDDSAQFGILTREGRLLVYQIPL